jgi:uncharacterized protein (DUF2345 family)
MTGNANDNGVPVPKTGVQSIEAQNKELQGPVMNGALQKGESFPEFQKPHILVTSPSGIETTSYKSTHFSSEENMMLTTSGDATSATDGGFFASVKDKVGLFAQRMGLNLLVASGAVTWEALSGAINLASKMKYNVKSDTIELVGVEKLVINGGGSTLTLNAGGVTWKTGGAHLVKCGGHTVTGPAVTPATNNLVSPSERGSSLDALSPYKYLGKAEGFVAPDVRTAQEAPQAIGSTETHRPMTGDDDKPWFSQQFTVVDKASGNAVPDTPYYAKTSEGTVYKGKTDKDGKTERIFSGDMNNVQLIWGKDAEDYKG